MRLKRVVWIAVLAACGTEAETVEPPPPPPPVPPTYPVGPYGAEVGDVIENLGLTDLAGAPSDLEPFYQSDAKVLLLYMAATWCFTCGPEIDWLNERIEAEAGALDAAVIVVEDHRFERPAAEDGIAFRDRYGVRFATLVDADGVTEPYRAFGAIPLNIVLRTKDMTIAHRTEGFDPDALGPALRMILEEE